MARKWAVFFRRLYTVLTGVQLHTNLNRKGYRWGCRGQSPLSGAKPHTPSFCPNVSFNWYHWLSSRYLFLTIFTAVLCLFTFSNTTHSSTAQVVTSPIPEPVAQTPALPLPANSASDLAPVEREARANYTAGRFHEAIAGFQQAAQFYQVQGNSVRQSLSLTNLSLSHQQLGRWNEATEAIAASLALVERDAGGDDRPGQPMALAQALESRGNLERSRGQTEQAIATWERAIVLYQSLDEAEAVLRSRISQAQALQELGLYSRAILVLETALQSAAQTGSLSTHLANSEQSFDDRIQRLALPDSSTTVVGLRSLVEALQVAGNPAQASAILELTDEFVQKRFPAERATTALSLGNATRTQAMAHLRAQYMTPAEAMTQLRSSPNLIQQVLQERQIKAAQQFNQQTQDALNYYQQSLDAAATPHLRVQALLNRFSLLLERQTGADDQAAIALIPQIEPLLTEQPAGTATDLYLNFARHLLQLADRDPVARSNYLLKAAQWLKMAHNQAIASGDFHTESYALGFLAEVYERNQQWKQAEDLTQQALQKVYGRSAANVPHSINDTEMAYRWQQQRGRILKAQNKIQEAIAAYEEAITILQTHLRLDIASSNLSFRFAFLQEAEQMHEELLDLLLWDGTAEKPSQANLQRARAIASSLLEVEVTSFLQEPCDVITPEEIDDVLDTQAKTTAIIYPIVLPNRLELIVKRPQGDLLHYRQPNVRREQVLQVTQKLQHDLQEDYTFQAVQTSAKQLYDWIIQPITADLTAQSIDTLVFSLNRQLQRIPMSVLFDGNQYLIDRYAVSTILGLNLTNPTPLERESLRVLAAGLADMPAGLPETVRQNFLPLPNVEQELKQIGTSTESDPLPVVRLINEQFTRQNFNTRLNQTSFSVVHLATHGQFSFQPEDTFLLTANDGDNTPKIDVNTLAALFRVRGQIRPVPIELLVLNACETATGDDLAALGIAGTAVRAGARSVIASLWILADAPSALLSQELYKHLGRAEVSLNASEGTIRVQGSKAHALRQAQLKLKQNPLYAHPRYWAPYILAGNWL